MSESVSQLLKLPHLCRRALLIRVLVIAQAVAILLAFSPASAENVWLRLGIISLVTHWIVLLTLLLLCQLRLRLNRLSPAGLLIACFCILLGNTLAISFLTYSYLESAQWLPQSDLISFLGHNLLLAVIVGALLLQFLLMHNERSQRLQAQSRAELVALQARIQPHFLFNSLNTAAELTQTDPDAAEEAMLNLAALFRAALHAGESTALADEIALAQQYLALEQWRLGARLRVAWLLPDILPDIRLPTLTLQPLLENAVRHGVESCPQGGEIKIELLDSRRSVTLLITNPFAAAVKSLQSNGVAIDNIRQRLRLWYAEDVTMTQSKTDGYYRIKLVLPKTMQD